MVQKQKLGEQLRKMKEVIEEKEDELAQVKADSIKKYLVLVGKK